MSRVQRIVIRDDREITRVVNVGAPGTGLHVDGVLSSASQLPGGAAAGDAYLVSGDLWVWNGAAWVNAGPVQGPKGDPGSDGADAALPVTGPRIVTLVGAQEDETPDAQYGTVELETNPARTLVNGRAWRVTTTNEIGARLRLTPYPSAPDEPIFTLRYPPAVIGLSFYTETPEDINYVRVEIGPDSNRAYLWMRQENAPFKPGWNHVRFRAIEGDTTDWGQIGNLRVHIGSPIGTVTTIAHVWAECHEKAQIVIVADGCRAGFFDIGVPDLRERNFPVTWAPSFAALAQGRPSCMTTEELLDAAKTSDDEISFHSWGTEWMNDKLMADMTPEEIREDTMRSLKRLASWGHYPIWRAAWLQNNAPNHAAAQGLLPMYASPTSNYGYTEWPPIEPYNIRREILHSKNESGMDAMFANLKRTNAMLVVYTHDITENGSESNMSQAQWDYFVGKLDEAIGEGWLEGVTMGEMARRNGWRWRTLDGEGNPYPQ